MSSSVGDLVATLSLDTSDFRAGTQSASEQLRDLDTRVEKTIDHTDQLGATQSKTASASRELGHATSLVGNEVNGLTSDFATNTRETRSWGDSLSLTAKAAGGLMLLWNGLRAFGTPGGGAKGLVGLGVRGASLVKGAVGAQTAVNATRDLVRGPREDEAPAEPSASPSQNVTPPAAGVTTTASTLPQPAVVAAARRFDAARFLDPLE